MRLVRRGDVHGQEVPRGQKRARLVFAGQVGQLVAPRQPQPLVHRVVHDRRLRMRDGMPQQVQVLDSLLRAHEVPPVLAGSSSPPLAGPPRSASASRRPRSWGCRRRNAPRRKSPWGILRYASLRHRREIGCWGSRSVGASAGWQAVGTPAPSGFRSPMTRRSKLRSSSVWGRSCSTSGASRYAFMPRKCAPSTSVTSWSPMTTVAARVAPILPKAARNAGRQRLHGLRHDGQRQAVRKLVDALVPVVRHEAERDAGIARLREPEAHVARHLVRVARKDGVVDVEQDVAEAERQQVALDVDVRQAREVAVGFKKRHGRLLYIRDGQASAQAQAAYENVFMCSSYVSVK